jgi:two-component sensor histidine kinase
VSVERVVGPRQMVEAPPSGPMASASQARAAETASRASMVARAGADLTMLLGAVVLVGWLLDIPVMKSVVPGAASIKANAALCFILCGIALRIQVPGPTRGRWLWAVRGSTLLVAAVALATLAEYQLQIDLHMDQLVFRDGAAGNHIPGRMAPNAAAGFLLLAAALARLDERPLGSRVHAAELCALGALTIGTIALVGYCYGVSSLYWMAPATQIAMHAASGFILLSGGVLAARSDRGVMAVLTQDNGAGASARRLVPVVVALPLVMGWIRLRGERGGLYGTEIGLALMVVVSAGMLTAVVLWNARVQGAIEIARQRAERDQRFLFDLGQDVGSPVEDADELLRRVAVAVGERMGLSRCFFSENDPAHDRLILHPGYVLPGAAATTELRLSGLGTQTLDQAEEGRTLVSDDTSRDPRTAAEHAATYGPSGLGATVTVPLRRGGLWVAGFTAAHATAHVWQPGEIALVQAAADRAWTWSEHARTVRALRESEEFARTLADEQRALGRTLEERVEARTLELTSAHETLARSLKEKDVLLKEIHHRVKNNLQVISSLLNLQAQHITDEQARALFRESQGRVQSIALVHEKLHQAKDLSQLDFEEYVWTLVANVFFSQRAAERGISSHIEVDGARLEVDMAIPCGLIINELVTNALKHAFPEGRSGTISIILRKRDQGGVELVVGDDGVGLPPDLDLRRAEGLGLDLVFTFAEQLEATVEVERTGGTVFHFAFHEGAA